jgi:carbon-monoxide dehydrogenase medium subunit
MIPAAFDYHAPATLDEALALLSEHGDEAKLLSGGQSLLPLMKLRFAAPEHIVDINRIPGLAYIEEGGGFLRIGALVRESELERSELVARRYPILQDTAAVIADPLVRNRATVAGNLAHGDPANDHPATMLALGAELIARGPQGERSIPVAEFFEGLLTTALRDDEILTEIRIPEPAERSGGAYLKLERKVGDYATAAAACLVALAADGSVASARIALTNLASTPVDASAAAEQLLGRKPTAEVLARAGELAAAATSPSADRRGSVEYKRAMARVLTVRSLEKAFARAAAG